MKQLALSILSMIFLVDSVLAASVKVGVVESNLFIEVNNIVYPDSILNEELNNGLPNVFDIIVKLKSDDGKIYHFLSSLVITYDLWDENYFLSQVNSKGTIRKTISKDLLLDSISNISLSDIMDVKLISSNAVLEISAQIVFNPITSEKIKKIKNWIHTSNGYNQLDNDNSLEISKVKISQPASTVNRSSITQAGGSISQGRGHLARSSPASPKFNTPRFQKLFDKILEENMSEDAISAQWKSEPFVKHITVKSVLGEK